MQFWLQDLSNTFECDLHLHPLRTFPIYAPLVLLASLFIGISSFPASLLGPVILLLLHSDKYSATVQRNDGADLKTGGKRRRKAKLHTAGGKLRGAARPHASPRPVPPRPAECLVQERHLAARRVEEVATRREQCLLPADEGAREAERSAEYSCRAALGMCGRSARDKRSGKAQLKSWVWRRPPIVYVRDIQVHPAQEFFPKVPWCFSDFIFIYELFVLLCSKQMTIMTLFNILLFFTSLSSAHEFPPFNLHPPSPPVPPKKSYPLHRERELPHVFGSSESVVICSSPLQDCCLWILKLPISTEIGMLVEE